MTFLYIQAVAKNSQSPSKSPVTEVVTTATKPKPAVKKTFKLTYKQEGSPARHVVQEITNELTFGTLVGLAEEEFGISESKQRFKMGFPPKPIKMDTDELLKVSCLNCNIMSNFCSYYLEIRINRNHLRAFV